MSMEAPSYGASNSTGLPPTYAHEENAPLLPRFASFWKELGSFTRGAYGNLLSEAAEEDVAAVYPPRTLARLSAVKGVYDPGNIFHRNQNIRPRRP